MAVVMAVTMLAAPTAASAEEPAPEPVPTLTGQPLPTWQTNGTVWSIAQANGIAWVAGSFTKVRPPGAAPGEDEVDRRFAAAFDAATGELLPWNPIFSSTPANSGDASCDRLDDGRYECGTAWEVKASPDGETVYFAGDFDKVNGRWASIAAFSTDTGEFDTSFRPGVWGRSYALAVSDDTVYVGGTFTQVAPGTARTRAAAFSRETGELTEFAPQLDDFVRSMTLTEDQSVVVLGGAFGTLNGRSLRRLGAVYATDGSSSPWNDNRINSNAVITDMVTNGDTVLVTGETRGTASEGVDAYDPMTGTRVWYDNCKGASHSVAVIRGVVYAGSHAHDCRTMVDGFTEQYNGQDPETRRRFKLRAQVPDGTTARLLPWSPQTDDGNGPRAMAATEDYLWVGGEFRETNYRPQQGLTRFGFAENGAPQAPPRRPAAPLVFSTVPGQVSVTLTGVEDRDSRVLTYEIIRNGNRAEPVHSVTLNSRPWAPPVYTWVDRDVVAGASYTYDIRAIDEDGNIGQRSPQVSIAATGLATPPGDVAQAEGAKLLFRLGEDSAPATNAVSGSTANTGSSVGFGAAGPAGLPGTAADFPGEFGGVIIDRDRVWGKKQVSVEAWFSTTTTVGGQIVGQGTTNNTESQSSNSNSRKLYMLDDGRISWGVRAGARRTVTSVDSYNDGSWHHAVGILDPVAGLSLYVDGVLVGADPTTDYADAVRGYWRIGGDRTQYWPNRPSSDYFDGLIDEVALYPYPMPAEQVARHAAMGSQVSDTTAPTQVAGLTAEAGETEVALNWGPATDDMAVTLYEVHRGPSADFAVDAETLVISTGGTTAIDTPEAGTWFYRVVALDAAGNRSVPSDAVAVAFAEPPVRSAAVADTWVNEASQAATAGGSWVLKAKGAGGERIAYLSFDVAAAPAGKTIDGASLQLTIGGNAWAGSAHEAQVRLVPSGFDEGTLSWATRPAPSSTVLGVVPAGTTPGQVLDIVLNSAEVAALAGGQLTLALVGSSSDGFEVHSREASSGQPRLELRFAGAGEADATAPVAPVVGIGEVDGFSVPVTWSAVSDPSGLSYYRVSRSSDPAFPAGSEEVVAVTLATSATDSAPVGTSYYRVVAVDGAGNESAPSGSVTAVVGPADPVQMDILAGEDSWANEAEPASNYGNSWVLKARQDGAQRIPYLKFAVPAAPEGTSLSSAELKLQVFGNSWSGSADDLEVVLVPDASWTEGALHWDNRPALSETVVGTAAGGTVPGQELTVPLSISDLSALAGQTVALALTTNGGDGLEFSSSESGADSPELHLVYAP